MIFSLALGFWFACGWTMMSPLFLAILALLLRVGICTDCDTFYECYKQSFTDKARCFGFASCLEAKFTSDATVRCDGDHSCYKSIMDVTDSVKCRSAASCDSATIKTNDGVHCEGICFCDFCLSLLFVFACTGMQLHLSKVPIAVLKAILLRMRPVYMVIMQLC